MFSVVLDPNEHFKVVNYKVFAFYLQYLIILALWISWSGGSVLRWTDFRPVGFTVRCHSPDSGFPSPSERNLASYSRSKVCVSFHFLISPSEKISHALSKSIPFRLFWSLSILVALTTFAKFNNLYGLVGCYDELRQTRFQISVQPLILPVNISTSTFLLIWLFFFLLIAFHIPIPCRMNWRSFC